jgi:hypothetical protein
MEELDDGCPRTIGRLLRVTRMGRFHEAVIGVDENDGGRDAATDEGVPNLMQGGWRWFGVLRGSE